MRLVPTMCFRARGTHLVVSKMSRHKRPAEEEYDDDDDDLGSLALAFHNLAPNKRTPGESANEAFRTYDPSFHDFVLKHSYHEYATIKGMEQTTMQQLIAFVRLGTFKKYTKSSPGHTKEEKDATTKTWKLIEAIIGTAVSGTDIHAMRCRTVWYDMVNAGLEFSTSSTGLGCFYGMDKDSFQFHWTTLARWFRADVHSFFQVTLLVWLFEVRRPQQADMLAVDSLATKLLKDILPRFNQLRNVASATAPETKTGNCMHLFVEIVDAYAVKNKDMTTGLSRRVAGIAIKEYVRYLVRFGLLDARNPNPGIMGATGITGTKLHSTEAVWRQVVVPTCNSIAGIGSSFLYDD